MVGLTSARAAELLAQHGPNALPLARGRLLKALKENLGEPLVLLLLVVGVAYAVFGELQDALIIFGVILAVSAAETWTEMRAGRALRSLEALSAPVAHVWRDGELRESAPAGLVIGDVIALRDGSRVPADARVVSGQFDVDEALVTGESLPVPHAPGDGLLAGTLITSGRGAAEVTATGPASTVGRIANLARTAKPPRTPLQLSMKDIAGKLVYAALTVSLLVPVIGWLAGRPAREMLLTGLTLAFATIPEELPILIVIVLGLGSLALAQRGAIVRRLIAAETLGAVTVVCTDKTGTLTENRPRLARVFPSERADAVLRFARLASPAPEEGLSDPLDRALWEGAGSLGARVIRRFPFDHSRRLESAVVEDAGGLLLVVKGSIDALSARLAGGEFPIPPPDLRCLGVASRCLAAPPGSQEEAERELKAEGIVGFEDAIRPEVSGAVRKVLEAGVHVSVLTGDSEGPASRAASSSGLELSTIPGHVARRMSERQLAAAARRGAVFTRLVPEDKLRIVKALGEVGEVVAVTGDGANDAPALAAAAIGVAMGKEGSDVAREAAGLVLTDDNFSTLAAAVQEGRRLFTNLRKAVSFYLAAKVALIGVSLVPAAAGLPLPFTPIQIVFLELFMDLGASVAFVNLGPEPGLMKAPPRNPRAAFLDMTLISRILAGGLLLGIMTGAGFLVGLVWIGSSAAHTLAMLAWLPGHTAVGAALSRQTPRQLARNHAFLAWGVSATAFAMASALIPQLAQPLAEAVVSPAVAMAAAGLALSAPLATAFAIRRAS